MTQLTAASDLYDRGSSEYHELSESLKTLVESAYYLRTAWEMLDTLTYTSRREGRHDDSHDLRSPEQSAYLAWQAAELAYQQIIGRLVATMDAETGEITIAEPDEYNPSGMPSEPAPARIEIDVYCAGCGWQGTADPSIVCPRCGLPDLRRFEPAPESRGIEYDGTTSHGFFFTNR